MEDITPFLPGDTVAYLRLADGERRFPFRPVATGLFLIGQGPGCDLRLGVPDIPSIHSALHMEKSSGEIVRIAEWPSLLVNGESVERTALHHGDLIEIGDVRLLFFLCEAQSADSFGSPQPAAELNAGQLVAGLEAELQLLSAEDSGTDRIHDLIKAAHQAVDACQFAQTIRFADYAAQKTDVVESSQSQNHDLILTRLAAQETRLDEICNVLEQVVNQQQMIATALQCVVERLNDFQANSPPGTLRASA